MPSGRIPQGYDLTYCPEYSKGSLSHGCLSRTNGRVQSGPEQCPLYHVQMSCDSGVPYRGTVDSVHYITYRCHVTQGGPLPRVPQGHTVLLVLTIPSAPFFSRPVTLKVMSTIQCLCWNFSRVHAQPAGRCPAIEYCLITQRGWTCEGLTTLPPSL